MSDDENFYSKTSISVVNQYLYPDASSNGNTTATESSNDEVKEQSIKHRSKSNDELKSNTQDNESDRPYYKSKTKVIERGVKIKNLHSLVDSQNAKLINEKEELNELNQRLDKLVESIKTKKSQNDQLENEINHFRQSLINNQGGNKKQLAEDLDFSKRELNEVSEMSTVAKIRASRSLYDLHRLKEKCDEELKHQSNTREKIRTLENQRASSLHELSFLKESYESRQKSIIDDANKNEQLREHIQRLNDNLDHEQKARVEIECQIQTMLEQKKFDEELHKLLLSEMEQLCLYQGANKLNDPTNFYNSELREIKERIREDFRKMSEYNFESMREEYEMKCVTVIEEIETKQKQEELARKAALEEENANFISLRDEFNRNENEINSLRMNELRLTKILEELNIHLNKTKDFSIEEQRKRDEELAILNEQIKNLKNDLSSLLGYSKSLDAEVAVYARLLNQRFYTYINESEQKSTSDFVIDSNIKKPLVIVEHLPPPNKNLEIKQITQIVVEQTHEIESDLIKKKLKELDEQKKLREQEEQRRIRELEEHKRRQREEHQRRELEEQNRRQREIEEQRRLREQEELRRKEIEEQRRREEHHRREIEEFNRRQKEIEDQKRREIEEQKRRQKEVEEFNKRQRELEEQRKLKEIEEQQRKQREMEEQKRLRELEDQRRLRELEEQRRMRDLEEARRREEHEQKKKQREKDELLRRQRELEEQKRLREFEEQRRRDEQHRLELEEQRRIDEQQKREIEDQKRRQREIEEQNRRQRELEEYKKKQREIEEQSRRQKLLIEEQTRRQQELEEIKRREIEEQKKILREQEKIKDAYKREIEVYISTQHKHHSTKNDELERQERIKTQREEHEKYIIEKLRQEQELLEIQKRKQLMHDQNAKEVDTQVRHYVEMNKQPQHIKCIDKISSYTQHIVEEKHKSSEFFEEHRIPVNVHMHSNSKHKIVENPQTSEKQINIRLMPLVEKQRDIYCDDLNQNNYNVASTSILKSSNNSNLNQYQGSFAADHCLTSNNGNKQVLIVNTYNRPKSLVTVRQNMSGSNITRSQSPPLARNVINCTEGYISDLDKNKIINSDPSNKYAIKHKANRYVSGAIGILETSLNGEFIILENLSSNKTVNLKGWYIHRYVPDQNINVIYKFTQDCFLLNGEKLKIYSKSYDRLLENLKADEKVLVAENVKNWGKYSKFSVTKLINPEGVDKAVLTQSLLRLASSSTNVNKICQNDVVSNVKQINMDKNLIHNSEFIHNKIPNESHHLYHQVPAISNHSYVNNTVANNNHQSCISTATTKTSTVFVSNQFSPNTIHTLQPTHSYHDLTTHQKISNNLFTRQF